MAEMVRRAFETPLGEVWLWGEPEAFEGSKPVVLVIHGAFEDERTLFFNLPPHLPDAAVLLTHLPGNHCPELAAATVGVYAVALDHVLHHSFDRRLVVACGASVGALVALALNAPELRAVVAIEPPLRPETCWPLIQPFRIRAYGPDAVSWEQRFVEGVLGYLPDRIAAPDYTGLIGRLRIPVSVILGGVPLEPKRPLPALPSLVGEPERDLLRQSAHIAVSVGESAGHAVHKTHDRLVVDALRKHLDAIR